jgi:acetoin utilization protein AcuB
MDDGHPVTHDFRTERSSTMSREKDPTVIRPRVADFMTKSPHCIGPRETLSKARRLMQQHLIRHLPVVDGDGITGMLSERDLDAMERYREVDPERVTVAEAMTPVAYTATPDEDLDRVAAAMVERRCGSAIIVDHGEVVGLFTTTDALRAVQWLVGTHK